MGDLSYKEQSAWREYIEEFLKTYSSSRFYNVHIINPVRYYNFEEKRHKTEQEVMNFDLHKVRTSNLVIVNFNDPKSLGTMAELAVAHEHNIPIIGLNTGGHVLHPWSECLCERIFDDMDEMLSYVVKFYLN